LIQGRKKEKNKEGKKKRNTTFQLLKKYNNFRSFLKLTKENMLSTFFLINHFSSSCQS
jgi:hypothetical protein